MKVLSIETKNKIKELTKWNNHSEARILLASELGFKEFAKQFKENQNSYEKMEELSKKLFSVVFLEHPDLYDLF
tara:strand:- start:377 stop:598 length:222 start_codon:yes stop_codon:yes gene_type:complete